MATRSKAREFARLANRLNAVMDLTDNKVYLNDVDFGSNVDSSQIEGAVSNLLFLNALQDVNSTATANQVLTATGDGAFFFANNAAREIHTIMDLGILDGTDGQVLHTDGDGSFTFQTLAEHRLSNLNDVSTTSDYGQYLTANGDGSFKFTTPTAHRLNNLIDVESAATKDQVLTANGDGTFFFANNAAREVNALTDLNITDGTAGQVLKTDGEGAFYFDDEDTLNSIIFSIALG
jgi:hypothetical protein